MDLSEATRIVFKKIQKLEPENVTKIIGYLLLHDHGDQEMIRLAFGPDKLIHTLINKVKIELGNVPKSAISVSNFPSFTPKGLEPISNIPPQFMPCLPASPRQFPSPATSRFPGPYWNPQLAPEQPQIQNSDFIPYNGCPDSMPEDYGLVNQNQFLNFEDQLEPVNPGVAGFPTTYLIADAAPGGGRVGRRSQSFPEFPTKACLYFNKGFCKHGNSCRYLHGHSLPESFNPVFGPNSIEFVNDGHIFSHGSLENLELEIIELLKSRRGHPISIASLPLIYYEKYGKVLQAEGYLTESQRHGKAGYSLTKLLARLKNNICVIDSCRPHGQHAVILAEDASKYMENRGERSDPGPIVSGSRQIYLTFPAESSFTEEDVSNYFSTFGPVEDVRIPCQQKRMFGFVTFSSLDTVKMILSKGNPHFVCGARVLVKPYREKTKFFDRKYSEKVESPYFLDVDSDFHSMRRESETSRYFRNQLSDYQLIELERRHFSELQDVLKPVNTSFVHSMNELKLSEDHSRFPSVERFNHVLDVLTDGSTSDDQARNVGTDNIVPASSVELDLPESPFASAIPSSI